jgi:hypothetical protein
MEVTDLRQTEQMDRLEWERILLVLRQQPEQMAQMAQRVRAPLENP